jgi:predicted TPR repeat methyltransferase
MTLDQKKTSEIICSFDPRIPLVLKHIRSTDVVLDLGFVSHTADQASRPDWLHKHLCARAKRVIGIDWNEQAVNELGRKNYEAMVADVQDFDLGIQFDVVVAGELIEHLLNVSGMLGCVKRHLKKDGRLIITTPNVMWFGHFLRVLLLGEPNVHHEHTAWYCAKTLTQALRQGGFKVVEFSYIDASKAGALWRISRLLRSLGMERIGGQGLFVVCQPA